MSDVLIIQSSVKTQRADTYKSIVDTECPIGYLNLSWKSGYLYLDCGYIESKEIRVTQLRTENKKGKKHELFEHVKFFLLTFNAIVIYLKLL